MKGITNSKEIEKELTRIFDRFNHHFWNDELPDVIITFKPTRSAAGHMTVGRVWLSDTHEAKYELNIDAFTLNRAPEDLCATLLHEQCHLYCSIHDIQDTSNDHRYHNKNYKKVAEEHGLDVEKHPYLGWTLTTLSKDALKYFKRLNVKQFAYHYARPSHEKRTLLRYQCPSCKRNVAWVSKARNLICGDCMTQMVYVPLPDKSNETKALKR